jgi:hypothetical protein
VLVKLIDAATAAVAIPVRCPAQGFAPLGHPDRDARPQLHRPVRSAGWEWSSGRRLNRTGRGRVPHPLKELPPCIS